MPRMVIIFPRALKGLVALSAVVQSTHGIFSTRVLSFFCHQATHEVKIKFLCVTIAVYWNMQNISSFKSEKGSFR